MFTSPSYIFLLRFRFFFFNTMILSLPPKRLLPRLSFSRAPFLLVENSYAHTELTVCEALFYELDMHALVEPSRQPQEGMLATSPLYRGRL